jgi:hypothetical protein
MVLTTMNVTENRGDTGASRLNAKQSRFASLFL